MIQEIIPSCPEQPTKSTKWEPEGGVYLCGSDGSTYLDDNSPVTIEEQETSYGTRYRTREQAEWASRQMRSYNRLLCWLVEHDDGWRADFSNGNQLKYSVYYNYLMGGYRTHIQIRSETTTIVVMSQENAELLAQELNDGIVEL